MAIHDLEAVCDPSELVRDVDCEAVLVATRESDSDVDPELERVRVRLEKDLLSVSSAVPESDTLRDTEIEDDSLTLGVNDAVWSIEGERVVDWEEVRVVDLVPENEAD